MISAAPRPSRGAGVTQERGGLVRLEIADGRPGKEAGTGMPAIAGGSANGRVKSAANGSTARPGWSRASSAASCTSISPEMSTGT